MPAPTRPITMPAAPKTSGPGTRPKLAGGWSRAASRSATVAAWAMAAVPGALACSTSRRSASHAEQPVMSRREMACSWRNPGHSSSISGVWRLNGLHPAPATSIQERWSERPGLSPRAWPACGAPSPPARERPAIALFGVVYPDHPGWSGCGNPQYRSAGDGRRQRLKLDAS